MNYKNLLANFSIAVVAQGTGMLVGLVMTLLVPKILNVSEYGYWQLFLFYATYVGFFHFGLNDGVYLIHGGESRESIDKVNIGSQFIVGICYQAVIAIIIAIIAILSPIEENRMIVLIAVAFYLVLNNAALFLGFLFQALNETKLYSFSVALNNLVFLPILLILVALRISDFYLYLVFYIVAKIVALIFCIYKGREFVISSRLPLKEALSETWKSISVGSKLLIASIASLFLIGSLQFFIDFHWGIEVFGKVSLAISLCSLFQTFISQASMVLFPALRQTTDEDTCVFFQRASKALGMVLPAVLIAFYPVALILEFWLPQYHDSILMIALLLPVCVFEGRMDILGVTFLKVLRMEKRLLWINVAATVASACLVALSIFVLESLNAAILSVDLVIAIRSIYTEGIIKRVIRAPRDSMAVCSLAMCVLFIGCQFVFGILPAFLVTLVSYIIVFFIARSDLKKIQG